MAYRQKVRRVAATQQKPKRPKHIRRRSSVVERGTHKPKVGGSIPPAAKFPSLKKVELAVPTDPKWVKTLIDNFDEFLADHADCERKASAMALRLVAKCSGDRPEIIEPLINLAIEELTHFRQVYA